MDIKIVRFSTYPEDEPIGIAVGFSVTYEGRQRYADTIVGLEAASGKSDDEISVLAWEELEPQFTAWKLNQDSRSPLLGSTFVVPEVVEEEVV